MKRRKPNRRWFSRVEEAHLQRLVDQAFDVRKTPYLRDACEAIDEWAWRTRPDRLQRHAQRIEAAE